MASTSRKLYDLTHSLNPQIQVYPGDPKYAATPLTTVAADGYQIHGLSFGSHTGTHIDAPSHFVQGGDTIDQIPLDQLVRPAVVIDVSKSGTVRPKQKITWSDIQPYENELKPGVIALIYMGWYEKWGTQEYFDHPYLTKDAAEGLIACGIRVVGVDTLNPDETVAEGEGENGFGFHSVLLGAGGIIAENVTNLKPLVGLPGLHVSLLPLKLEGIDGSPVRAIAWQMD
ncbi:putative cyclase [Macrolepiota fuliginosa MF-IS2]|uniref:Cyclase n=1 Tax=Macrolepiota fuliginosa MF-IS2 TaxID=1400762 RepID=A0A9P6C4H1_9AGAR|nr:putative cyclase [Macrolepiota fuliginosa MF-IS2]